MHPSLGPAVLKLQEHSQEFNVFLSAWTAQQSRLLEHLSAMLEGSHGVYVFDDPQFNQELLIPLPKLDFESDHAAAVVPRSSVDKQLTGVSGHSGVSTASELNITHSGIDVRDRRSSSKTKTPLKLEDPLRSVVHHRVFAYASGIVIFANAGIIAAASEYAMSNPEAPNSSVALGVCESACAVYYVLEIIFKIYVERSDFWKGFDRYWNLFDLCLALQALIEQTQRFVVDDVGSIANLSFARMLRLLKTLKLLRVIRLLAMFRELRLLLSSLLSCLKAFGWACILMMALCFMTGLSIMQFCSHYTSDTYGDGQTNPEATQGIHIYWSSVALSMVSLFMACTNGQDWADLASPLKVASWSAYTALLLFVALFNFVVLNIVNSIFIETVMNNAAQDSQLIIDTMIEKTDDCVQKLQDLYDVIDDDGDGVISYEEFCQHVESPEFRAFLSGMEIDISDAKHFFRMLSAGGTRAVDLQSFVAGCFKLKGLAKSMDLMDLLYQHKRLAADQRSSFREMRKELTQLAKLVAVRFSKIDKQFLRSCSGAAASDTGTELLTERTDKQFQEPRNCLISL